MHSDKWLSRYGLLENFNSDIIRRSSDILSHKDYIPRWSISIGVPLYLHTMDGECNEVPKRNGNAGQLADLLHTLFVPCLNTHVYQRHYCITVMCSARLG